MNLFGEVHIGVSRLLFFSMLASYCTEYNINGILIEENYGADCSEDDSPCQPFYNSAEAYKCQFNLKKKHYSANKLAHAIQ